MKVNGQMPPPPMAPHQREEKAPSGNLGKNDFLMLLTAQLAQQDPLNPMDNTEFVAQLSSFASLERLENMSHSLDNMALAQSANTSAQVVSFIGNNVEFVSDKFQVTEDGPANEIKLHLDEYAEDVEISIMDESGRVIKTIQMGRQSKGTHTVEWDGTNNDGSPVAEGTYTVEVTAKDSNGDKLDTYYTHSIQEVEGVTFENGFPMLILKGGGKTTLGDVREIKGQNT